ncbi:hypothetical protein H632_c560p0 [Helicosporidium sp. ATCC 50920]|nr:hypothetical protein H632_c560p0 [Helicosporidium sp. ATCC 50920]|eukprot:KDD75667.1 hypothetical protein H632_c560p0 [Helicosporidium sp. ATCC 50920]
MRMRAGETQTLESLREGLARLGYDLTPSEVSALLEGLDADAEGRLDTSAFVASQLDWASLAASNRDLFLDSARRAFEGLGADEASGRLSTDALLGVLRSRLPETEVDWAVEDALVGAGYADAEEIDFEGFLKIMRANSVDDVGALEQYDPRLTSAQLAALEASAHGGAHLAAILEKEDERQE